MRAASFCWQKPFLVIKCEIKVTGFIPFFLWSWGQHCVNYSDFETLFRIVGKIVLLSVYLLKLTEEIL